MPHRMRIREELPNKKGYYRYIYTYVELLTDNKVPNMKYWWKQINVPNSVKSNAFSSYKRAAEDAETSLGGVFIPKINFADIPIIVSIY